MNNAVSKKNLWQNAKIMIVLVALMAIFLSCGKKAHAEEFDFAALKKQMAEASEQAKREYQRESATGVQIVSGKDTEEGIEKAKEEKKEEKEEKAEERKVIEVSGSVKVLMPYVSEYTGEKISNGPIYIPSMTLTHSASGWYISALGYVSNKELEEIDFFLGKTTDLGKGVTLDTGVGVYVVQKGGDYFAVYLGAEFPEILGVVPFAYVEADMPINNRRETKGGVLWKVGAKKNVKIGKQVVEIKGEIGGNSGIYGSHAKAIDFARVTFSTEVKIFGCQKIVPMVAVQKGFGGIAGNDWRVIGGVTIPFGCTNTESKEEAEEAK